MSYVETSATLATVRMPSIVQEMQRAHKARLQRIKDAAIGKPAPPVIADDPMVAILESAIEAQPTWEDRQKAHWFSIVESGPIPRPVRRWPTIMEIQRAVCLHYGVSRRDMLAPGRHKSIALARQIAVYICRRTTIHSLPELGRRFGGRDHTTQIHAVKKIRRMMEADPAFAAEVEAIIASLGCSA